MGSPPHLCVACISHPSSYVEDDLIETIKKVKTNNPKVGLIVLPEGYHQTPGSDWSCTIWDKQKIYGPLARELSIYIALGLLEESDGKFYSSFITLSPSGEIVAHKRATGRPRESLSAEKEKRNMDQCLPPWVSTNIKFETIDTHFGRMSLCCGGPELLRIGPIADMIIGHSSYLWVGGAYFQGKRTIQEIRKDLEADLFSDPPSKGSVIASCFSQAENSQEAFAVNIIWDFSGSFTTCIDVAPLQPNEFHITYGTVPIEPDYKLPKRISTNNPPEERKFRVASIQHSSDLGTLDKNQEKMVQLAREAASNHATFIVFPEAALTGYLSQDLKVNWAVGDRVNNYPKGLHPKNYSLRVLGEPDKRLLEFQQLCEELNVYLVIPFVEIGTRGDQPMGGTEFDDILQKNGVEPCLVEQDVYFNSAILMSPHVLDKSKPEPYCRWSHYRKRSPWPHPEVSWAEAGQLEPAVADTPYGRVGLAICFDIHTVLHHYKPHNIDTLLYPIAWVDKNPLPVWFHGNLGKYVNSEIPNLNIVGANWSVDQHQSFYGYGCSSIYSAGNVLATTETFYGNEIIYADLDIK